MYSSEGPSPGPAFDHPGTRAAWQRLRRRVRARFLLWSLVFVGLFALGTVLNAQAGTDYVKGGSNQLGPAILGLSVLWYPFVLYSCLGALSRLKKARRVLETYPWQVLPAARKASGRESTGVPVHLALPEGVPGGRREAANGRLSKAGASAAPPPMSHGSGPDAGDAGWSPTMCARDPRRWNRWAGGTENGAWFAGDPCRWGVLARPGGVGLMTVQRSQANLSSERTSGAEDLRKVLAAAPHG